MKYICKICGYIYDDLKEKVPFNQLPNDWKCPLCGASKSMFELLQEKNVEVKEKIEDEYNNEDMQKISNEMLSTICSNLSRGCEKQYKFEEMELFEKLSQYFERRIVDDNKSNLDNLIQLCKQDIDKNFQSVDAFAKIVNDRGSLRAKTWSEKVTIMLLNLLERYKVEGDSMLEGVDIWVCTICGFVYIGKELPEICPVCKVPNFKFEKIEGRN